MASAREGANETTRAAGRESLVPLKAGDFLLSAT